MSGGLVNPAECIAYTVTSAVETAGLLVAGATSARTVDLCGGATADAGDITCDPVGYTFANTKIQYGGGQPMGDAQTGKVVGIGALIPGQIIEIQVPDTHAAIAVGDELQTATGGKVVKKAAAGWVVGRALSALGQDVAGFVQIRVYKRYASS